MNKGTGLVKTTQKKSAMDKEAISFVADLTTLIVNAGGILGSALALFGASSAVLRSASPSASSFSFENVNFPIRISVLIFIASALGWIFGMLLRAFSKRKSDAMTFAGHIVAVVWAGLLIGVAEWIAAPNRHDNKGLVVLFCAIGACFAVRICVLNLHTQHDTDHTANIAMQTIGIAVFAVSTLILITISQLIGV